MVRPLSSCPFSALTLMLVIAAVVTTSAAADSARKATSAEAPTATKKPHTTEIHGTVLNDDYYWLRERDNPDVISYLEAENAYTEAMTAHLEPIREEVYEEILGRIKETDLSVPELEDGWYYYRRTEEGKQYPIYARKQGSLEADEEIILDVNTLAADHEYFDLGSLQTSPDHNLLAYSFDIDGSELYTLVVKDLETGKLLDDRIEGIAWSIAWGNDNRTLFYTIRDDARRPHEVWRHVLGDDGDAERVFHEPDDRFFLDVDRTRDERFIKIGLGSSITSEYYVLDADRPGGEFTLMAARENGVEYHPYHHGEHFYIRTNADGAKNFKLIRVPDTDLAADAEEVVPHRPDVKLESVYPFKDHMVFVERTKGLRRLRVHDLAESTDTIIPMPETAYAAWPSSNPEFDNNVFRFTYTSLVTPRTVYDFDMATGKLEVKKRDEVLGGYEPSDYVTERTYARAQDGTAIPMTLFYKRGVERNGDNPTLLYGYGSYGSTIDPSFSAQRLSLVDRGFVFALAHPRGGGLFGEPWHDDGKMLNKRNTFTDFIDAAEHLVDQRWTRPERLGIQGGSAGGLLVGAVVNMRPDLFGAALAHVPFVDVINTMLDESIPLTVIEFEEWGNPKNKEFFDYMLSYSPYDNVTDAHYPDLLITAGLNDPRVQYWEPAKWTAKLRQLSPQSHVMLKTNMGAGHGGASGRYDYLREWALYWAFLIDTVGGEAENLEAVEVTLPQGR
ncbi:MAG: S9 family peptidase [Acidobacteriota bacterium]